jgi:Histidine kinase-, DNA gyrase B-, and HSP90-like ATPase
VPYVPVDASFSTAEADLLKLLVAPLYGDRPEIGVRELVQNAIDAVRESTLLSGSDTCNSVEGLQEREGPDVRVQFSNDENGVAWLEVDDRGVGMTADIVRDYFLRAGASFRFSDAWRRAYEDSSGESRVLRSGRIGVGAVAAFLLGDLLEVTTRHIHKSAEEGITFRAHLEDETVELRKVNCPSGTTVRVRLYGEVAKRFDLHSPNTITPAQWDWYYLNEPRVQRILFGLPIQPKYSLPLPQAELPAPWHRLEHPEFADIHWSYANEPALVSNGTPIVSAEAMYVRYGGHEDIPVLLYQPPTNHYRFYYPSLSVFDPNGRLPVNLQRTGLAEPHYPFTNSLRNEVFKDFIAYFALSAPNHPSTLPEVGWEYGTWRYPGVALHEVASVQQLITWSPIFETCSGVGFSDADLFRHAGLRRCIVATEASWRSRRHLSVQLDQNVGFLRVQVSGTGGVYRLLRKLLYPVFLGLERDDTPFAEMSLTGVRVCLARATAQAARTQVRRALLSEVSEQEIAPGWVEWTIGVCGPRCVTYDVLMRGTVERDPRDYDETCIGEVFFAAGDRHRESLLANEWLAAFGASVIPFSEDERVALLLGRGGAIWHALLGKAKEDIHWFSRSQSRARDEEGDYRLSTAALR